MEIYAGRQAKALKAVLYGPEGIGKSTLAAAFPEPLFIDTEGSTAFLDARRFKRPETWAELTAQVRHVRNTPGLCRTLVIDTADWAEQLCSASLCASKQLSGIEDLGYGKGYVYLAEEFGRLLNLLEEVVRGGVNAVLTAHAMMRKFEQPDELGAYDRWELKLQKKTAALVKEWSDALLFANYKTYAVAIDKEGKKHKAQGGKRVLYTAHHPCWDAKNRQGLPEELPLEYSALGPLLFPETPAPAPKRPEVIAPKSDIPEKLWPLLEQAGVTEDELREVIAGKGYFPADAPWSAMESAGFVDGWVIPFWDKIVETIESDPERLPF